MAAVIALAKGRWNSIVVPRKSQAARSGGVRARSIRIGISRQLATNCSISARVADSRLIIFSPNRDVVLAPPESTRISARLSCVIASSHRRSMTSRQSSVVATDRVSLPIAP